LLRKKGKEKGKGEIWHISCASGAGKRGANKEAGEDRPSTMGEITDDNNLEKVKGASVIRKFLLQLYIKTKIRGRGSRGKGN